MAYWKKTDPEIAMLGLRGALDEKHDPLFLEKIAKEAPLENIRKLAAEYKEELEGYVERAEKNDPKCPRCGAPLVEAPYYTAIREGATVTRVETKWEGPTQKRTVTYNIPYRDLHLHTDAFCPRCAARKARWLYYPFKYMFFGGLIAAFVFGVMLLVVLIGKKDNESLALLSVVGLGAGILMAVMGLKLTDLFGLDGGRVAWADKKKAPLTTEEFNARDRGVAFYGPKTQYWRVENYCSPYDISRQYLSSRTLDKIPHEETANTALGVVQVRLMQEENRQKNAGPTL